MKRYHEEKHIIEHRAKLRRTLLAGFDGDPTRFDTDLGRFRKAMRCAGCGRARCQVCHSEKFPKRIPTRKEKQANYDFRDYEAEDPT